jgi:hypothetical protein
MSLSFKNKKVQTDQSSTKISEENSRLPRHVQNPQLSKTRSFQSLIEQYQAPVEIQILKKS